MVPDGASADGGVPDATAPKDLPPATVTAEGVLTAFSHIRYQSLDPNYRILTMNFVVTPSDDPRGDLIGLFAEIENLGTQEGCSFLTDTLLDGQDMLGSVEGPPHFVETGSTVTTDCIAPGGVGVLDGIARGIDLASARTLTLDMNPFDFNRYNPAAAEPARTESIVTEAGEWRVEGTLTPHINIRNYKLGVYPVDERGLIIGNLLAFPAELANLPAGTPIAFATDGVECAFETYHAFQSWIQESSTSAAAIGPTHRELELTARRNERQSVRDSL